MGFTLQPQVDRARVRSAGVVTVLDVLDVLDRHGPTTLAELARETGAPKSTLHRVCSMMFERGWIARDANTGDTRARAPGRLARARRRRSRR